MADTFIPPRILTVRGMEIELELAKADTQNNLLRCIAEAIAHLESRLDAVEFLGEKFRFYKEKERK